MWTRFSSARRSPISRLRVRSRRLLVYLCLAAAAAMAYRSLAQPGLTPPPASEGLKLKIEVVGGFRGECLTAGKSGVCLFSVKGMTRSVKLPTLIPYGKGKELSKPPCEPYLSTPAHEYEKYEAARIVYEFTDSVNAIVASGEACMDDQINLGDKLNYLHPLALVAPKARGRYGLRIIFDNRNLKDAAYSYNSYLGYDEQFTRLVSERVEINIE